MEFISIFDTSSSNTDNRWAIVHKQGLNPFFETFAPHQYPSSHLRESICSEEKNVFFDFLDVFTIFGREITFGN